MMEQETSKDWISPMVCGIVIALATVSLVPTSVDDYLPLWHFLGPFSMESHDIDFRKWGNQFGIVLGCILPLWIAFRNRDFVKKVSCLRNLSSFLKMLGTYVLVSLGVMFSLM
jgi:hypothetical protein